MTLIWRVCIRTANGRRKSLKFSDIVVANRWADAAKSTEQFISQDWMLI